MYPDPLFTILGFPIRLFLIVDVASFILTILLAFKLTRERFPNHPLKDLFAVSAACTVADLALTPVIVWIMTQFDVWLPLNWSLGQIIAVLIGLSTYHILARRHVSISFSERLNLLAPPMRLFIAIYRLGCLAAGCCYGVPAPDLPWAITFTNPHAISIYKNIPVHPTQLYESVSALIIFGIVMTLRNHPIWRSKVFWLALLLYGTIRFAIEFYRGDVRPMIGILSINQIICIILAIVCGSILVRKFTRRSIIGTAGA